MRRRSSRIVYENPWMRVREDEIRRPDGSPGIFGVIEKDDFALIIPLDDGSVWLVEQYRYPVQDRFWEFPQGSWDDGSAGGDPEQLALAELREETGLRARSLERVGYLYEAYGYADQGFHVFVATDLVPGEPDRSIEEQDMRARRVDIDEFERMVVRGEVRDAPSVAAYGLIRLWKRRGGTAHPPDG